MLSQKDLKDEKIYLKGKRKFYLRNIGTAYFALFILFLGFTIIYSSFPFLKLLEIFVIFYLIVPIVALIFLPNKWEGYKEIQILKEHYKTKELE